MKEQAETRRRFALALLWAVLGYSGLTVFLTWPATANFSRAVAGFEGLDSLQYTWSMWWSGYAWRHGQSPAQLGLLYHPWGGLHPLLDLTPMIDWLAFPLQAVLTPTQVYNALFLASFILTGATMYLLALDLTKKPVAAFCAGAIFCFFPNRMGHALSGHLTQLVAWWFPLYILCLLRLLDRPRWHLAVLGGVFLGLSTYVALVQTAYFVIPATVLVLFYSLIEKRKQLSIEHLRAGALCFGVAAFLVLPKYGPFIWRSVQQGLELGTAGAVDHSVDLLTLFVPSPYHPLWGNVFGGGWLVSLFPEANELEHMAFLGWIPLALSVVAIIRRRKQAGLWVFVGFVSLWLSLGPLLRIGGSVTGILQPYALLARLPFYRWGRTPERFNELTMFCIALLAAHGLASLRLSRLVQGALIALVMVEMMVLWPFPQGTPEPPAQLISWRSETGAVLDLPIKKRQIGNLAMYYQTTHHRPIVGGYIHRDLPWMREYVKAVDAALTDQAGDAKRALTAQEMEGLLQGLDIRHVLLHRQFVKAEWVADTASRLQGALGDAPADLGPVLLFDVAPAATSEGNMATFDSIVLAGVELEPSKIEAGKVLTVTCHWKATERPDVDYTVFIHVLDGDMERVAQEDGQPLGGNWPTTLWAPGQVTLDQHMILLPDQLPLGEYKIGIGLYQQGTGERVRLKRDFVVGVMGDDMLILSGHLTVGG